MVVSPFLFSGCPGLQVAIRSVSPGKSIVGRSTIRLFEQCTASEIIPKSTTPKKMGQDMEPTVFELVGAF
jgi:hypothetical protein